jgi:hypothetical protein
MTTRERGVARATGIAAPSIHPHFASTPVALGIAGMFKRVVSVRRTRQRVTSKTGS